MSEKKKKQLKELYIEELGQVKGGTPPPLTTLALGEEVIVTSFALGEETPTIGLGEDVLITSYAIGEETPLTTLALGEEDGGI